MKSKNEQARNQIKETLSALKLIENNAHYRSKLKWTVSVIIGRLYCLINDNQSAAAQMNLVNQALKKHYVERLEILGGEADLKQTFS